MMGPGFGAPWLRLQLAWRAANALTFAALLLCAAALAALALLLPAESRLDAQRRDLLRQAALPAAPVPLAPPASDADQLALFYASLGSQPDASHYVKTLFSLAGKAGLELRQGQYKALWDGQGRLHTYQITLPVKGNDGAIWRFVLSALRAMPFAALNDISFQRDAIGEAQVEARVRLTLYLNPETGTDAGTDAGTGAGTNAGTDAGAAP